MLALRDILAVFDIPELEPVPRDTCSPRRSFF